MFASIHLCDNYTTMDFANAESVVFPAGRIGEGFYQEHRHILTFCCSVHDIVPDSDAALVKRPRKVVPFPNGVRKNQFRVMHVYARSLLC